MYTSHFLYSTFSLSRIARAAAPTIYLAIILPRAVARTRKNQLVIIQRVSDNRDVRDRKMNIFHVRFSPWLNYRGTMIILNAQRSKY